MPLIKKPQVEDMTSHVHDSSFQLQAQRCGHTLDENDSGYQFKFDDLKDEECLGSDLDLEGSIVQTARPRTISRPPAVPPRSDKRASKMLANVMLELQSLDGSMAKDLDTSSMVQETDPHELYLSSEEDESLADDYEDSLLDFEPMDNQDQETERERASSSGASSRKSQEVTARVVSFTLVKPQIIHILSTATPKQPSSASESPSIKSYRSSTETRRRPSPLKRYPNSLRRLSISSIASLTHSSTSTSSGFLPSDQSFTQPQRQLRKTSRIANLTSLVTSSLPHSFLNSDPYPSKEAHSPSPNPQLDSDIPTTPKTPTSMAAAAFKKGLTRGLNRARKPSMPSLSSVYNSSSRSGSMVNLSQNISQPLEQPAKEPSHQRRKSVALPAAISQSQASPPPAPHQGPLTYEDIMKSVIRQPPPKSPLSAQSTTKVKTSSILGLGRRKSVKAP
ncbi:uncharacterized protein BP5553_05739 [Venustampulla echinocandica]|uniref:Uncharacterized protein n=1 Tax=Venustampulla echinocandica TaxID=2656787 RepID=A0A370TLL3_9HELO|nr:uncharacterized protein BP5553_05739 [Venustampulla echinocandica]RDL36387.1 hypothetical protein BP5553_05739 [Venustampulla echinocandica]